MITKIFNFGDLETVKTAFYYILIEKKLLSFSRRYRRTVYAYYRTPCKRYNLFSVLAAIRTTMIRDANHKPRRDLGKKRTA